MVNFGISRQNHNFLFRFVLRCEWIVNCKCSWAKDWLNRPILARFMAVFVKNGENGHKLTGYPDAGFLCFIPADNYHHGMFHLYEIHFVSNIFWAGTNLALSRTKFRSKTLDFGRFWRKILNLAPKILKIFKCRRWPLGLFVCTTLLVRMQNDGVVGWAKKFCTSKMR